MKFNHRWIILTLPLLLVLALYLLVAAVTLLAGLRLHSCPGGKRARVEQAEGAAAQVAVVAIVEVGANHKASIGGVGVERTSQVDIEIILLSATPCNFARLPTLPAYTTSTT